MTKICLIRHGETEWNATGRIQGSTDIPLNEKGMEQAGKCRDALKAGEWDVIITSPLTRAKQTATIINEALGMEIVEMEYFAERYFGDAEGMTLQERMVHYPTREYPNQEDSLSFSKRVVEGMNKINENFKDKRVLLVAHGAVIHRILTELSEGRFQTVSHLNNACFSHVHYRDNKWNIIEYNNIEHLEFTSEK
ncbi:histidine phosphatase family protein [Heyndrickxia acidicola]|uniref:Histidine phosphatase family protein n=1 Tax=Heyndrickxia acidicola TaxID=209389 RepID=A0ABU6MDC0_9BACI|nr:histidine phosphatase family protein [Heyndrickxia acidicola]MED1201658.1 histidine phosphatase family protein [Heyndrickxia acidicola]